MGIPFLKFKVRLDNNSMDEPHGLEGSVALVITDEQGPRVLLPCKQVGSILFRASTHGQLRRPLVCHPGYDGAGGNGSICEPSRPAMLYHSIACPNTSDADDSISE